MSSDISMITPPVSLSEVRGTQAASKLKAAASGDRSSTIEKSAREFEAVLLSHWLEQAEQSFATVPGSDSDQDQAPGHDQMLGIAMQAIGSALSGRSGGLGIASLVTKHLEAASEKHHGKELVSKDLHVPGSRVMALRPDGTEREKK